jgi:hypothetical protein
MRTITITVKEIDEGENASINVYHSNSGGKSELELAIVSLLDEYLFTKVSEINNPEGGKIVSHTNN